MSPWPVLMLGAGRMGGAMIEGWRLAGCLDLADLIICDPNPGEVAQSAAAAGARLNPDGENLVSAQTVVLAVKPQIWRAVAREVSARLAPEAVIVSIAAGVSSDEIAAAFDGRRTARVMPTTASAIGQGVASLYAADPEARARARALFAPLGAVVDLSGEDLLHAATAVSGSSPAYFYAFVEALEAAGAAAGLAPADSARLARATMAGAAALMARSGVAPSELRRQVTSPGGTTQAALEVLTGETGLGPLLERAVRAAERRSRELGG